MTLPLLKIEQLKIHFKRHNHYNKAVDGVDLSVNKGEILGLVGESGCGKSVTALSVLRLLPPSAKWVAGSVVFNGRDITLMPEKEFRKIRGKDITMIFQDPLSSLNPVFTIGIQMTDVIRHHLGKNKKEARQKAIEMLHAVRIPDPETKLKCYPHQLSGGMRQRVMIAMALSCHPSLLIADEPTTALDMTTQAQILRLMKQLKHEYALSILMISHDFSVVAQLADRIAVMYAGKIVEQAPTQQLFQAPSHPYTVTLLQSLARICMYGQNRRARSKFKIRAETFSRHEDLEAGCPFAPRCLFAEKACMENAPPVRQINSQHWIRCFSRIENRKHLFLTKQWASL